MTEILLKGFLLLTQLDNEMSPGGSCNLTCVAMCLLYLGKSRDRRYAAAFEQFEDELQQRALDNGWDRHEPGCMQKIAQLYGATDELLIVEGWDAVGKVLQRTIAHLKAGKPAIVHSYLTDSGHIVCLAGVRLGSTGKPTEWFVVDPYGEYYPSGYQRNYGDSQELGKYWLSHKTFTDKVLTDAALWVHLIS